LIKKFEDHKKSTEAMLTDMARLSKDYSERVKEEEGILCACLCKCINIYGHVRMYMLTDMARLSENYSERVKEEESIYVYLSIYIYIYIYVYIYTDIDIYIYKYM
jgi:hypothetical protein